MSHLMASRVRGPAARPASLRTVPALTTAQLSRRRLRPLAAGAFACALAGLAAAALTAPPLAPRAKPRTGSAGALASVQPANLPATQPVAPAEVAGPVRQTLPRLNWRVVPVPPVLDRTYVSDEEIGRAIERGVDYLCGQFADGRLVAGNNGAAGATGENALAVYALLQCGKSLKTRQLSADGPVLRPMLDTLQGLPVDDTRATYTRSLRATVLSGAGRRDDRDVISDDVRWLLSATPNGAYTYSRPATLPPPAPNQPVRPPVPQSLTPMPPTMNPPPPRNQANGGRGIFEGTGSAGGATGDTGGGMGGGMGGPMGPAGNAPPAGPANPVPGQGTGAWDNSNSQYGLLGVWSASEVGAEIPDWYWLLVEKHWAECQLPSGQWYYMPAVGAAGGPNQSGTQSMTLGGIASLFVTHDWLEGARFGAQVGREPFSPPLAKGMAWLETADNCAGGYGYSLFGLERVGLASGFKYLGTHDWYREQATNIVRSQQLAGGWNNVVDTSYHLLFLAWGRHPVLMNKLRFEHFWANRPRDVASLARYASRDLEQPFNWQVVRADREWSDWMDAPILYLASHEPPKMTAAELDILCDKLRSFVNAGGLIFTQSDGGSDKFNKFADDLAKKLFPQYDFARLSGEHELYTLQYKVNPRPPLKGVGNGARLLMVHSPTDLSMYWNQRTFKSHPEKFQLGLNLFIYAAGKSDYRNRLNTLHVAPVADAEINAVGVGGAMRVARLRYAGNWDPEPYAWQRFGRWFQRQTSAALQADVADVSAIGAAPPDAAPLAHLTGTAAYAPSDAEIKSLRQYVEGGGVLFIDACGGGAAFNDAVQKNLLAKAFPDARPHALLPSHPLFRAGLPGMESLPKPMLRPYVLAKRGAAPTWLQHYAVGKGHVLYSSLDVTSGLLATKTWGILGYEPEYAQALLKNLILWRADGSPDN